MKPLKRVGRPKAGEGKGRDSTFAARDTAYLAARLRRDHPQVLAAYREAMLGQPGRPAAGESRYIITGIESDRGTSRAYSLSRVQRECDAPTVAAVAAVAAVMAGAIKAAGNAKRAAAAKVRPRDDAGKLKAKPVADHNEPRLAGGKHPAREARAAEAHVSSATMARAEQMGRTRPVGGDGTSETPGFP
jgi:hypothetical protein